MKFQLTTRTRHLSWNSEFVLSGGVKDLFLLDVTPSWLGIETLGGVTTKFIPFNTTVPKKRSEVFSTAIENQRSVEIHDLHSEREFTRDNKSLSILRLDGIMPAPKGLPQIEVAFDIDGKGILSVPTKYKGTGKEKSITTTRAFTLPKRRNRKAVLYLTWPFSSYFYLHELVDYAQRQTYKHIHGYCQPDVAYHLTLGHNQVVWSYPQFSSKPLTLNLERTVYRKHLYRLVGPLFLSSWRVKKVLMSYTALSQWQVCWICYHLIS